MYRSWAYIPKEAQKAQVPQWNSDLTHYLANQNGSVLAYGAGRSYGDSCFNSRGTLIDTKQLKHFISFDSVAGNVTAEPGVTLDQLLKLIVPMGWFLCVTPGTAYATLGGALANDIHGKNHHVKGTFGHHVTEFNVLRTDGEELTCSKNENVDLFRATIGGLGLTGIITQLTISLQPIKSSNMEVSSVPFRGLSEYLALSKASYNTDQYSVAWMDCMSGNVESFKGIFYAANHAEHGELAYSSAGLSLKAPALIPSYALNKYTVAAFNKVFYWNNKKPIKSSNQNYRPFFYPLDKLTNWNNIYGKKGFYQCQLVLPLHELEVFDQILSIIRDSKLGSFLTVLKEFGSCEPAGLLSFPRPGICLAMDFSNRGSTTISLLKKIEQLVVDGGGSIYPAKDRLMSAESFKRCYPEIKRFSEMVDPGISSDYWRRVNV